MKKNKNLYKLDGMIDIASIPKADMHVHLEATMTPAMMKTIAARNGLPVPEGIVSPDGARFTWPPGRDAAQNLAHFVAAYDAAASVLKTAQDFTDITRDYLLRAAAENCIYAEITISPDHGAKANLTYPAMLDAIVAGYESARAETGIEARFIAVLIRHYGVSHCLDVARTIGAHSHPLVAGVGLAGDENAHRFNDFAPAFDATRLAHRAPHAAEAGGFQNALDALSALRPQRLGHGVRLVESEAAMRIVRDADIALEICVSSNMALKVFGDDIKDHPLRRLYDFGLPIVLGSDDPSFFGSTIGGEYALAHKNFNFTEEELRDITRTAIERAFIGRATRERLLKRC